MKTIYSMRHSTKVGTGDVELSLAGVELAKSIGAAKLRGLTFTHLYVSPLSRTSATMKYLAEGAEDFPEQEPEIFPPHFIGSTPDAIKLWQGVCHEAEEAGKDMMQAALTKGTKRAEGIATDSAEAFRVWMKFLPEDATILVVHHSPFLELLAYGLFGEVLPQLQPCEGFWIIDHDGELILKKGL